MLMVHVYIQKYRDIPTCPHSLNIERLLKPLNYYKSYFKYSHWTKHSAEYFLVLYHKGKNLL